MAVIAILIFSMIFAAWTQEKILGKPIIAEKKTSISVNSVKESLLTEKCYRLVECSIHKKS